MQPLLVPFEMKLLDEKGLFEGYGSTFGNLDLGKDIVEKGAFTRSLKEHKKAGTLPAMYWMHDRREPIGDWLEMEEDDKGLRVKGQLWCGETESANKAYRLLKGTSTKGLSIGYGVRKSEYDDKKGIRKLIDCDLPEVSVVGYGMNPKALVTSVKSALEDPEFHDVLDAMIELREMLFDFSMKVSIPEKMEILGKLNRLQIRDGDGKYQTLSDYIRGRKKPTDKPINLG